MDKQVIAKEALGMPGRMISYSKGQYNHDHPRNLTVFNGNVCTKNEKIWWGDLDITEDEENFNELSKKLGETIYILYECDARFDNEEKPLLEKAVAKFDNGIIDLGQRGENFDREDGKLLEKRVEQEAYVPKPKPEWEKDETKYPQNEFHVLGQIPWTDIEALQEGPHYYENDELSENERKMQNPLNHFFTWANDQIQKFNVEKDEKVDLYLRSQDEDRLTEVIRNFLINRMSMEEGSYRLKKEIGSLTFVMPNQFYDSQKGPKWTTDDIAYLRRMGEYKGKPFAKKDA